MRVSIAASNAVGCRHPFHCLAKQMPDVAVAVLKPHSRAVIGSMVVLLQGGAGMYSPRQHHGQKDASVL